MRQSTIGLSMHYPILPKAETSDRARMQGLNLKSKEECPAKDCRAANAGYCRDSFLHPTAQPDCLKESKLIEGTLSPPPLYDSGLPPATSMSQKRLPNTSPVLTMSRFSKERLIFH